MEVQQCLEQDIPDLTVKKVASDGAAYGRKTLKEISDKRLGQIDAVTSVEESFWKGDWSPTWTFTDHFEPEYSVTKAVGIFRVHGNADKVYADVKAAHDDRVADVTQNLKDALGPDELTKAFEAWEKYAKDS